MNEKEKITLERSLKRFFQKEPNLIYMFQYLITVPNLTKAEIFRMVSSGHGSPSTHCSGKPEDKMKFS